MSADCISGIETFRDEVRAFLASELTDDLRRGTSLATSVFVHPDITLRWQKILHRRGWAGADWPSEFGGPGWSEEKRYIFAAECGRAGAPALIPLGLKMVAPVIMHYGTAAQKAYFLPRILSGEHYWCQGFSEPGAGSDLASLQLKAVRSGSDYVLNGSKIWTTHAHFATHMFCLVRTSTEGRPQAGISFLLLEMDSAGVTVEPIRTLAGEHEVNQVFFDDVRVPQANRLGEENEGWSVAKHLLTFERGGVLAPTLFRRLARLRSLDDARAELRARIDRETVSVTALEALERKTISGRVPQYMPSVLKLFGTETLQRIDALECELVGHRAWVESDSPEKDELASIAPRYLNNRAASIYAGSSEVQRDIIARALLG